MYLLSVNFLNLNTSAVFLQVIIHQFLIPEVIQLLVIIPVLQRRGLKLLEKIYHLQHRRLIRQPDLQITLQITVLRLQIKIIIVIIRTMQLLTITALITPVIVQTEIVTLVVLW